MLVTIDQAGRIVVPKAIRERFGLHKNSVLNLEEGPEGIVLKPAGSTTELVRDEQGWLTVRGPLLKDFDIDEAIREARDERFADLKLEGR